MATAYSLIRFSTRGQADGDLFRRQFAPTRAFCERHGLTLDTSLHEFDVRKHGISAFHGENMVKGPLAKFIALVDAGFVKPGSWLLVEEIDRLTRGVHSKAYGLCLTLFERGIKIVTLMDQEIYDLESINASLEKRLKLQLRLDSAHDYSRKLSVRIGAWWQNRREDARKGTRKASKVCPLWLEVVEGEFKPIAERIVVIIRVLEMSAAGMGKRKIASLLNNAKIPAFKGANGWHSSSVRRIHRQPRAPWLLSTPLG